MDTVRDFNDAMQKYLKDLHFEQVYSKNERLQKLNGVISVALNQMHSHFLGGIGNNRLGDIEDACEEYLQILRDEFAKLDQEASISA